MLAVLGINEFVLSVGLKNITVGDLNLRREIVKVSS